MQEMKGWERIIVLFLINIIVLILSAFSLRRMEVHMSLEIGIRYALLVGYLAFGGWVALRKGKQLGMVRKRVRNRPAKMLVWGVGLFFVLSVVTPW